MKQWFDFVATQTTQPLQNNNSLCALDQGGILYVGGEDASDFLQNQLSNDINHIDAGRCQLSSCSNSKGRMYGVYRVIQIEGGYLLLMPHSIVSEVMQRLQKFVLRSKVVLADISDSFASFTLTTDIQDIYSSENLPTDIHQVLQTDSLISVRLHAPVGRLRFLLLSNDATEAQSLWQGFAQQLAINETLHWNLMEIESGVPTLYPPTQDAFVLQMCNLDALDGVSFKKGCYPGQEVVARTHYLGKLKRRMFLAEITTDECPQPGQELTSIGQSKSDGSGKVVDAVKTGENRCLALLVAVIKKAEAGELVLVNQPQSSIRLLPLPYSLPDQ